MGGESQLRELSDHLSSGRTPVQRVLVEWYRRQGELSYELVHRGEDDPKWLADQLRRIADDLDYSTGS